MIKQLQLEIQKNKNIDAILITHLINVRYLSNFTGSNGQILLTPTKAYFITDFRYRLVAKQVLPKAFTYVEMEKGLVKTLEPLLAKHKIKKLGVEGQNLTYHRYTLLEKQLTAIKFNQIDTIIENLKVTKTPSELKLIQKAQELAEEVFYVVKKNLKTGKTEQELAWEIQSLGHDFGAEDISFAPIVGFKDHSASPHHQNTTRKLKKGDLILIDMGMKYQGYCSDMTRMIFTKQPTPQEKLIYNLVLEAQEFAINKMKAGIKGKDADTWSRDIITKAGYGKDFGHSLGHGIGLEVHERPYVAASSEEILPIDTIVTVEPGVYLEKSFGVRIEDMVLVKANKVINLTKVPKAIDQSITRIK